KLEVGSSSTNIFAFSDNPFAISTNCRCPILKFFTSSLGLTFKPTRSRFFLHSEFVFVLSTVLKISLKDEDTDDFSFDFEVNSLPKNIFSAIVVQEINLILDEPHQPHILEHVLGYLC